MHDGLWQGAISVRCNYPFHNGHFVELFRVASCPIPPSCGQTWQCRFHEDHNLKIKDEKLFFRCTRSYVSWQFLAWNSLHFSDQV